MANTYKDIVITPNKGSSTDDPKIVFSGGNTSVNTDITLRVYPDSNGTLSFEGSAGQLFSVTNDLTGSLFTVNDVSGIPSIEVDALGNVDLAPFGGNVGIGTSNPVFKLDVQGDARITGNLTLGDATTDTITVNAANFNLANNISFDSGTLFIDKNNDRIGIGTTNPIAKLDVKASDGTGLYIGTSSVNYYDANVHVLRSTLQIERMRIESGGNVGIGTSNPTAKLTINGGGITGQGTGLFVTNGDITTARSSSTGAIYFGSDSATKFLYHDGTAYYFGGAGNVITPQSYQAAAYYDTNASYYMDFDGGSRINNLQILGAISASTNTAFYYDAALEVRELNFAGAQADIANCAPRIGMHWGGRIASQIVLESSGRIAIRDNPGTGYEAFAAGATYIAGSLGVGTSPTGTPLTVSRANQGTITTFNGPTSSMVYQDFGSLSYFWNNNSDLYFGTYTANTLYISTNSSARVTVTSTGNVGIGTTSTSARLQVVGTSSSANVLYLNVGGNYLRANGFSSGSISLVGFENNVLIGNEFSGGALALIAGGSERVRVTSAGSVGIGTNSPGEALHVSGNALVSNILKVNNIYDLLGSPKLSWPSNAVGYISTWGAINTLGTATFLAAPFSAAPRGSIVLGDGMGSDVLAFNPPSTAELYNGTTWSSTTVTDAMKGLFQGKHSSTFAAYEITTANAGVRFTWTSSEIPLYIFLNALLISSQTQGNAVVATLETSTDSGSTWTTVTTTDAFNTWPGYTLHNLVNSLNPSSNRMRISFVRSGASNGNSIFLGQIGLINSYQSGNRLFNWNVNRWLGVGTISNGTVSPTAPLDVAGAIVARSGAITTAVASSSIIDNNAGIARFISRGPDVSTNGTFQLISTRSDGSSVGNRVIIDASGNMGIGATPNVSLNITNLQVGTKLSLNFGSTTGALTYNSYWDGAFRYMTNDFALDYRMNSGVGAHTWHTAPSGNAGSSFGFTERMRLDANGNVGIGTSTPSGLLHLQSSNPTIFFNSTSSSRSGYVGMFDTFNMIVSGANTGWLILDSPSGVTTFRNTGSEVARFSGSNFGIGTTSPTGKLDVWGAGSGRFIQTNPNDLGYALSTFNASAGNVEQFNIKHNLSAVELRNERGQLNLVTNTASSIIFYTANTAERMRIDSTGRVGIGNTAPVASLHVYRNVAGASPIGIFEAGSAQSSIIELKDGAATPNRWWLVSGLGTTTDGTFSIYDARQSTSRFNIGSSGNVGIGTATPASRLSVVGNAELSNPTYNFLQLTSNTVVTQISANEGGTAELRAVSNHPLVLYTNNTERMRIAANGNIGIGTSSPTSTLDVRGNVSIPSDSLSFGSTVRQMINLWSTSFGIGVQNNTQYFRTGSRFSWFAGGVHSASENDPGSGGAVAMTLTNGNLSVYSGVTQFPTTINLVPSFHATSRRAAIGIGDWTPLQDINGNGTRDFSIFNSSSGIHGLSIRTDGNVGIGNTSPGHKLSVNGTAYFGGKITSAVADATDGLDLVSFNAIANMRIIRNNGGGTSDGMYIGYGNAGSATTKIYGGGAVSAALEKFSTYTLEPGSFRSPIFYDSDNTAYYVDPAGLTNIDRMQINSANTGVVLSVGDSGLDNASTYGMVNLTRVADTVRAHLAFIRSGNYVWQMGYLSGTNSLGFFPWNFSGSQGTPALYMTTGSIVYAPTEFRTPIIYDSNDTAYYINPAGFSRTNSILSDNLRVLNGGTFIWQHDSAALNNKYWDTYSDSAGVLRFRAVNDAYNSATEWLNVTRSGQTPQLISLLTNTYINGNVGIGNTAPVLKLEVAGNMSVDAFIENSTTIATSYTITSGRNAMSAGPISINSGVTVTVPSGSTWTIV